VTFNLAIDPTNSAPVHIDRQIWLVQSSDPDFRFNGDYGPLVHFMKLA
ncbi:unnamed protein product, partial [Acidithrix sp. C25]